jgi:hypothetical protein
MASFESVKRYFRQLSGFEVRIPPPRRLFLMCFVFQPPLKGFRAFFLTLRFSGLGSGIYLFVFRDCAVIMRNKPRHGDAIDEFPSDFDLSV